ncbi:hypothetical protein GEMRC1_013547 [Eukaryota sp. GEM-RC1]
MLRENGYQDEHMIVMQYNDVPFNARNPVKGEVYNNPDHINYFVDIPMDYTGKDCTAANFLGVISGQRWLIEGGSGRFVDSTAEDNILFLFFDHGAPGLVAFPAGGYLYEKHLRETVEYMFANKRYNKMVFYTEACESGSMYVDWSEDLAKMNVYVTTAANPVESSYAYYYDKMVSAYLGDLYSITYMEDIDENGVDRTMQDQFDNVILRKVTASHPQQYGNMTIAQEPLSNFFAAPGFRGRNIKPKSYKANSNVPYEIMNTYDLKLKTLERAYDESNCQSERSRLKTLINAESRRRDWTDSLFSGLVGLVAPNLKVSGLLGYTKINHECYQQTIENFTQHCGVVNDYGMKYMKVFAHFCNMNIHPDVIRQAAAELCH